MRQASASLKCGWQTSNLRVTRVACKKADSKNNAKTLLGMGVG